MECEPAASELVVKVACALPLSAPVPSVVAPSLNVTVPVGVKPLVLVTVAVKVIDWPKTELGADELTLEVVAAELTVKLAEVALVSEPSVAVKVLPAPAVVGLIALKVATPLVVGTVKVLPLKAVLPLPIVTLLASLVTMLPN
jgi:hypothetical protein